MKSVALHEAMIENVKVHKILFLSASEWVEKGELSPRSFQRAVREVGLFRVLAQPQWPG